MMDLAMMTVPPAGGAGGTAPGASDKRGVTPRATLLVHKGCAGGRLGRLRMLGGSLSSCLSSTRSSVQVRAMASSRAFSNGHIRSRTVRLPPIPRTGRVFQGRGRLHPFSDGSAPPRVDARLIIERGWRRGVGWPENPLGRQAMG